MVAQRDNNEQNPVWGGLKVRPKPPKKDKIIWRPAPLSLRLIFPFLEVTQKKSPHTQKKNFIFYFLFFFGQGGWVGGVNTYIHTYLGKRGFGGKEGGEGDFWNLFSFPFFLLFFFFLAVCVCVCLGGKERCRKKKKRF